MFSSKEKACNKPLLTCAILCISDSLQPNISVIYINIAEPGALIGFAGPRVVKDTTGQDLPEDFQTAEFLLEHGFLDFIVNRKELKDKVNLYIDLVMNRAVRA